jgi:YVTN family beta-propeller protein
MSGQERLDHPRRGRARRLGMSLGLSALLAAVAMAPVSASTLTNAWRAKVGTGGANGTATINVYATGTGAIIFKLAKLKPSASLPVVLSKGTCSSVGSTLSTLASIKTTSAGSASRTTSLTTAQVNAITAATKGSGRIAIWIGTGTTRKCGLFAALAVPPYLAATIEVGVAPEAVVVTPIGILVTNWWDGTLSRVDPATNSVLSVLPLTITGNAGPYAITYGEGAVWVTIEAYDDAGQQRIAGSVERLDPTSGQVAATIPVGKFPVSITTSPGAVWVSNFDDGTVSRIDPATNQVSATITLSVGVAGVAYGFGSLWVANEQTGTVSRIDPATNQIVATAATVGISEFVTIGAGSVWVTNFGDGQSDGVLSRIDPATNQVVRTIPVGAAPGYVAYGGGFVWVALNNDSSVVQVDPATNTVRAKVSSGILVLDASAKVVGLTGIAATDHAVWAVQPIPVAGQYAVPGSLVRFNY